MKQYKLSNGWLVSKSNSEVAILHVLPLDNSIFRIKQDIEIPDEIFDAIEKGENNIKELFRVYKLHDLIFQWGNREVKTAVKPNNPKIKYQGKDFIIEEEDSSYFIVYELSRHGGGNRKIPISKEIYLNVRDDSYSVRYILKKYNLDDLDVPENNV